MQRLSQRCISLRRKSEFNGFHEIPAKIWFRYFIFNFTEVLNDLIRKSKKATFKEYPLFFILAVLLASRDSTLLTAIYFDHL